MSSALLSVLLVCNRRILRHRGKFSNMCVCILIDPHVMKSNSVSNVKKLNHGLLLCQNKVNSVYHVMF
jgi:hypothetical protein